ncbi:diphthamide synthesis protein [Nanoarchaeota archaeon]
MKIIHIPAVQRLDIKIPKKALDKLPEHIALFTPVQHSCELKEMKLQLEKAGKKVELIQTRHTLGPGQILGCNNEALDSDADAFFYVGDGLFHPKALLMKNSQPVHCYNPRTKEFFELKKETVLPILRKVEGARKKFYASTSIGVLVTTKTGQRGLKYKMAKELEGKFPEKKFHYFAQNSIDFSELDNFPYIDVWLNTACERIGYDDSLRTGHFVLNVEDV